MITHSQRRGPIIVAGLLFCFFIATYHVYTSGGSTNGYTATVKQTFNRIAGTYDQFHLNSSSGYSAKDSSTKQSSKRPKVYWDHTEEAEQCAVPYTPDGQTSALMANLILTHNSENVMQGALELIHELYNPYDLFVVHIDLKVKEEVAVPWRRNFRGCKNIIFTRERYDITWASWEIVAAELAMLKVALESNIKWEFAMMMDGLTWVATDAKTRRKYIENLEKGTSAAAWGPPSQRELSNCYNERDQFLPEGFKPTGETPCKRTKARCADEHCFTMTETPGGWPIYDGQQWAFLHRTFADWSVYSPLAIEWQAFFKDTLVPDEHYFSSVLYSSPFLHTAIIQRQIIFVEWDIEKCVNTDGPCEFTEPNLPLLHDQPAPYIRKVLPSDPLRQMIGNSVVSL